MKSIFTKTRRFLFAAALLIGCGYQANAQLAAGDLVFTSYNTKGSAGVDTFTFVLLKALPGSSTINFTDRGYGGSSYNTDNGSSETSIRWISGSTTLPIGTEVRIVGLNATLVSTGAANGTVTAITGTLGLSLTGLDQVIAYTGTLNTNAVAIAGIHWNNCSGATTTANWDIVGTCATVTGVSGSTLPPSLTNSNGAMWCGVTGGVARIGGKFMCSGTPYSDVTSLRAAILDNTNWSFITSTGEALTVPAGCTYYGVAAPTITTDPSPASVCASSPSSFSIAASNATSYKWQVKIGSAAFTDVPNAGVYSGATTTTLSLSSSPASANGYIYRAVAMNSGGGDTSATALLTVANGVPTISVNPSDAEICPAGSTILSAAATGGTITYKWQVSTGGGFTDITDGGVYSNSGTGSLSITAAPNSMYGTQYRLNATNACGTSSSTAATLTFRTTWTGTTSTNWNVAGNWSCNRVPDTLTDVVIGTASNQPTISTVANARNLILNTGGTLTISASNTLGLAGAITNAGGTLTATATNAAVNFNSLRPNQPVAGGTYFNVQFTGAGNKVLAGDVTVNGSANILTNQLVILGNYTLTIGATGSVSANASRYFVTNGTGGLKKMGITSTSFVYPVGSGTSYTPFLVNNSGGTSDNFTGRVIDGVYTSYVNDVPQGAAITSKVVNKTWFVTEDVPGGSNVQMIVQWNQSDELSGFVRTSIIFSHYTNGAWNPIRLQGASPSTGAGPYTATRTGINSFSPFGIGNIQTALPLNMLSFDGVKTEKGNKLTWATADEKNIADFGIERSEDGSNFKAIDKVAARNEAGSTANNYEFTDNTGAIASSRLYYRLKINEQDGTHNYSNTITINQDNNRGGFSLQVSPNPVDGSEIYIQSATRSEGNVEISIVDMAGKRWYQQSATLSGDRLPINVKAMPAGIYMIRVQQGATVQSVKLVRH